jgi:hypothetical protein
MKRIIPTLLAGAALLAGCATTSVGSSSAPSNAIAVTVGSCHAGSDHGQPLPDPRCTPGAVNPAVTQANIATTICRRGWTKTVRPPQSYTETLKRQQITQYGYSDKRMGSYEEDHLVSLELGGAPSDPANLWPEPGASPNPKDAVEGALNRAICSHRVTLAAAQQAIASDWTTAEARLGIG